MMMLLLSPFLVLGGLVLLVAVASYISVVQMSRAACEPLDIATVTPPEVVAVTNTFGPWLNANGFTPQGAYRFMSIHLLSWRQESTWRYVAIYYKPSVRYDIVTVFNEEQNLTSCSHGDAFVFPRPEGSYLQSKPGETLDALMAYHLEGEEFLVEHFKITKSGLQRPFLEYLNVGLKEQVALIRSIPFWPFRAVYWYFVRRKMMANRSVRQQYAKEKS
jgi:hypothetical protein